MIQEDFELTGRYFVLFGADGTPEEGWIRKNFGSGFFLVEVFIEVSDGCESVLRIKHFIELRSAIFYTDLAQAQRHFDQLFLETLPSVDLDSIGRSAHDELEDMVLEQLKTARAQNQFVRIAELERLLKHIIIGPA